MLTLTIITLFVLHCLLLGNTATATVSQEARYRGWDEDAGYVSTREEVLSRHRYDRKRYEQKLAGFKLELERHELGIERSSSPRRLKQKIAAYQRKIDKMQGDLTEFQVERVLGREDMYAEVARYRRSLKGEL